MCYCDAEPAQAWHEEWRKARKAHRCCECGAPIAAGHRYHHFSGIWDHQASAFKSCIECAQVRDFVERSSRDAGECGPVFSGLYDEMPRAEWPAHVVAAQDALRATRASLENPAS